MATINYNPQAQDLQLGWKPSGFLGGMLAQQQQARADQMNPVYDFMAQNDALKQAYGLNDYLQQRDSANAAAIAGNTAKAQTAIPEAQANLGLLEDKADLSRKTLHSRVAATIAEQAAQKGDAEVVALGNAASKIGILAQSIPANTTGPAAEAQLRQVFQAHGVDPDNDPVAKYIMSAGPGHYKDAAQHMYDIYDQASSKARQSRDIANIRGNAELGAAKIRGDSMIEAAKVRAAAKNTSYLQMISKPMSPEQSFTLALTILNDPEVTDGRLRTWATGQYQSLVGHMQNKDIRGQVPGLPGIPPVTPPAYPVGGGVNPQNGNPTNPSDPLGLRK